MQWMPLKLDLLPAVTIQTDKTLELYERIVKDINNGDNRQIPKLKELQNQIKRRIGQLDQFYDHHCYDQRIALFHRLKLQLMKVLAGDNQGTGQEQLLLKLKEENPKGDRHSIGVKTPHQKSKATVKAPSQKSLAPVKKPTNPVKQPTKKPPVHQNQPPTKRAPELEPLTAVQPSPPIIKHKPKPSNLQQQIESIVAMPPPQIVFTIKMTKQEYLQFLSAKQVKK